MIPNIVHIISDLGPGGAQVLLFDILNNLDQQGDLNFSVITINSGEYIEQFERSGIKVYNIKEKGLLNPKIYFKLKKLISEIDPEIVHTHLHKADFYGRIAAKNCKIPVIISTCHNYSTSHNSANENKITFIDRIDDLVIKYSESYIVAISKVVQKYLINRNKSHENIIKVIYNGVNIQKLKNVLNADERIVFRKSLNINEDDYVLAIIGRLEKQKGHLFFLESIREMLIDKIKIKLLIVGDGILRNEIQKFISENNLEGQVCLHKFEKNIEPFIEISDLICVPSLWEGFGIVILEGMIKSKIVLASDVGGIPEIITNGYNGFLYGTKNKKDLIEKIKNIQNDKYDIQLIKRNALKTVKEKFDISEKSEQYFKMYINLLSQRT